MRLLFIFSTFLFFASSCAIHSGVMTGNASITNANFKYVTLAQGTATTTHVLGIGGLKKEGLVFEAKKKLLENYPLRQGQALANVTVDIKKTFVFLVVKTKVTLTADVIDFNGENVSQEIDTVMANNYVGLDKSKYGLSISDSVYFVFHGHIQKGEIINFQSKSVKIKYQGSKGRSFQIVTSIEKTLLKKTTDRVVKKMGFASNEAVRFLNEDNQMEDGIIFGVNEEFVGIKYDFTADGNFLWEIIPKGRVQKLN